MMIGAILSCDPSLLARIHSCFELDQFAWRHFSNEDALLHAMRTTAFAVVMIDATVPGVSGKTIMNWRDCHAAGSTAVLMMTSFTQADVLARCIDAKPDELIALPPNSNELHARTWRAIKGRRGLGNPTHGFLHVGAYRLHHATSRIWLDDAPIEVTSREFALAWMLFSNLGIRLSREQISAAVWSTSSEVAERTLEQHIYKLRKKLKLSPRTGVRLRTLYSMGYKLEPWEADIGQEEADAAISREDAAPEPA
jgi:DNA-binding response OmpR family regulator